MRKRLALAGLCLFAASACVSQDDPSLTVQALNTDIAFGVEVDEPAGPPAPVAAAPLPATVNEGGFEPPQLRPPPSFDDRPSGSPALPPITARPVEDCPTAPPNAAAERIATENVTDRPVEGVYRWKREGTQTILIPETGDTVEVQIGGFERRIVQNVTELTDTSFSFEVVAPLLDRPAVSITTFEVETDPTQYQAGGAVVIDEPRVNDPEGGVTVQSVVVQEDDGSETSFNPTTGLLYIGLPVVSGEQFRSSAVDGRSGESIVMEAKVTKRDRIDACGDLADGWRVESTQTRTDASGPVTFNFLVAPQYGGIVIREEVEMTDADGNSLSVSYTLAQLEPDPLPEDGEAQS